MAVLVTCSACGAKLRVRDEYLGKEVWCPACKAPLTLTGERVPNHEVFVSYSSKDKTAADAICATLEEKQIRCWIAPRDISAGNSWGGSIIEAVEDAQVMVLVYSGHSNLSPQVIREVERAVAKGLMIVPFRIEAAPMSKDMEYFLSSSHWFDALTPPLEKHLAQFAEMVRLILFKSAKEKEATPGADHVVAAKPRANTLPWKSAVTAFVGVVLAIGVFLGVRQYQQQKDVVTPSSANLQGAVQSPIQTPAFTRSMPDNSPTLAVAAPQSAAQPGQAWTNSLGMIFVPVPGTAVQFSIWDTRVKDFEAFVRATGYDATQGAVTLTADGAKQGVGSWKSPGFAQSEEHPVCCVNWNDAKAFCKWLTEKERGEGRLKADHEYRLPTDAEWSVAVGLENETGSTPKERNGIVQGYPWGTQWPPPRGAGNYAGEEAKNADWPSKSIVIKGYNDGYPRTSPVGNFKANRLGLYDMSGNVWQFCEDLFDPGSTHNATSCLLRGGSWDSNYPSSLLSSVRNPLSSYDRWGNNGFRCVLAGGGVSASR